MYLCSSVFICGFILIMTPRQFRHLCRPVSGAIIDDYDPVRVLFGAQHHAVDRYLLVEGGEDGGYGGQVSTSGGWVWWVWVGGSG